jgi:predicted Fe-Mo cluster-binding NifX family protein
MKICLPVDQLNGLNSAIAPSFRAAPAMLIVDSETRDCVDLDPSKGNCGASTTHEVDAIICAGGMGRGLFNNMRQNGVRVFNSNALTVGDALSEMAAGSLEEVTEVACCGGDEHDEDGHHAAPGGCCASEGGQAGHAHGHGGCGSEGGHAGHGHEHGHGHGKGGCGCGH